jgi:hypothetical protein
MDLEQFQQLPNSTNAVESYNRFGKGIHRQPLKVAMMSTYREDMMKTLQIIAERRGLSTTYQDCSPNSRMKRSIQQNESRKRRLHYDS